MSESINQMNSDEDRIIPQCQFCHRKTYVLKSEEKWICRDCWVKFYHPHQPAVMTTGKHKRMIA